MDEIIAQILAIDAEAQKKLQDAYAQRDAVIRQIDADAEKEASGLKVKCESRIRKIYDSEKEEAETETAEIQEELERQTCRLEELFAENKKVWAKEIAEAVVHA